jgi:hypothetical protein
MSSRPKKPNALKHGATSQEPMLWGEKQEDYDALRDGLYVEWTPAGPTEENLVQTLLDLLWRSRRLSLFDKIKAQQKLDSVHRQNEISVHVEKLSALAPDFEEATSEELVEEKLAIMSPLYRNTVLSKWPLGKDEDPNGWGAKIAKGLQDWKVEKREGPNEFLAMSDDVDLHYSLLRREKLDAKIEQTIKRLIQVKAAKQAHRQLEPKVINTTALKAA